MKISDTVSFWGSCIQFQDLLGVVWSIECFKNYLHRKQFTDVKEHRALLSILKKNCSKSYNSRLSRWIFRLLHFQFDIQHLPGAKMRLVDYFSRHPIQKAKKMFPHTMKNLLSPN